MKGDYKVHIPSNPVELDFTGFQSRNKGLEIRDCYVFLEPTNKTRLGLLTRPPMEFTVAESIVRGGGEALNIDGCRVSANYSLNELRTSVVPVKRGDVVDFRTGEAQDLGRHNSKGRFPSNLILRHSLDCYCDGTKKVKNGNNSNIEDGSIQDTPARSWKNSSKKGIARIGYGNEDGTEEVPNWICTESCPVSMMDNQSGNRPSSNNLPSTGFADNSPLLSKSINSCCSAGYNDEGGASRFFKQVKSEDELNHYLNTLTRKRE